MLEGGDWLRSEEEALEAGKGEGEVNCEVVDVGEGKEGVDGLLKERDRVRCDGGVCSLSVPEGGPSIVAASASSYLSARVLSPQRRQSCLRFWV